MYYEDQNHIKRLRNFLERTSEISKIYGLNFIKMLQDDEYLMNNLSEEDFKILKYSIERYLIKKGIKKEDTSDIDIEWEEEITPYTILGISQKDYSKEELLDIVADRINKLECNNEKNRKNKIDEILDAYNEITKSSKGQK